MAADETPVETEAPEAAEALTAWHPLLVLTLDTYLPLGWMLIPELLLTRLPQRVDIVVLQLVSQTPGVATKLHSIFDHLRPHTLIEYKSPEDNLAGEDALVLLGYGAQYMRLKKLKDPGEVCLMVIADRIGDGFVSQVERLGGWFVRAGQGLWRGKLAGAALHGVETGIAAKRSPSEQLLYTFSRGFLEDPRAGMPLDEEARKLYTLFLNQIEQFRKLRGPGAMKYEELVKTSLEELMKPLVKTWTPEQIAKFFTPEQRLAGLTPEEIAKVLTPEEIERLLAARERAKGQAH